MNFYDQVQVKKIKEVYEEIERRKASRRDYLYPSNKLVVNDKAELVLAGSTVFKVGEDVFTEWKDAEAHADKTGSPIVPQTNTGAMPLTRVAWNQLLGKLGEQWKDEEGQQSSSLGKYAGWLQRKEYGDLLSYNLTELLKRDDRRFMLRMLDGKVRAVLSDSYKIMDNHDVFFSAAEALQAAGAVVWRARLSDDNFELFAVSEAIHARVQSALDKDLKAHQWVGLQKGATGWKPEDGDIHNAAVRISNSETGLGGLTVTTCLLRQVCMNTSVVGDKAVMRHLGRRQADEGISYADDTKAAEMTAIWLKLRDNIRQAFDTSKFHSNIDRLNGLAQDKIDKPEEVVKAIAEEFSIPEERRASILRNLFESRDLTRFGLIQSVTAQAHDADTAGDADHASGLEELGGRLMTMSQKEFATLAV